MWAMAKGRKRGDNRNDGDEGRGLGDGGRRRDFERGCWGIGGVGGRVGRRG